MAEKEGFEPPVELPLQLISSQFYSEIIIFLYLCLLVFYRIIIDFLLDKIFIDALMLPLKTESVPIDSQESNLAQQLSPEKVIALQDAS
jgi:hypothetical protein